jgi:hypothetical protein
LKKILLQLYKVNFHLFLSLLLFYFQNNKLHGLLFKIKFKLDSFINIPLMYSLCHHLPFHYILFNLISTSNLFNSLNVLSLNPFLLSCLIKLYFHLSFLINLLSLYKDPSDKYPFLIKIILNLLLLFDITFSFYPLII